MCLFVWGIGGDERVVRGIWIYYFFPFVSPLDLRVKKHCQHSKDECGTDPVARLPLLRRILLRRILLLLHTIHTVAASAGARARAQLPALTPSPAPGRRLHTSLLLTPEDILPLNRLLLPTLPPQQLDSSGAGDNSSPKKTLTASMTTNSNYSYIYNYTLLLLPTLDR